MLWLVTGSRSYTHTPSLSPYGDDLMSAGCELSASDYFEPKSCYSADDPLAVVGG